MALPLSLCSDNSEDSLNIVQHTHSTDWLHVMRNSPSKLKASVPQMGTESGAAPVSERSCEFQGRQVEQTGAIGATNITMVL